MNAFHRSLRRARPAVAAVTLALSLTAVAAAAAPAQAHETPKRGSTCAMSGMTEVDHGKVYVCTSSAPGAKPRWGAGLPISAAGLTMADGWAKAAPSGMTAAFGLLTNTTDKPIRIIGAFSSVSPALQLHEVVMSDGSMVMQQKTGGYVIPARSTLELKPGGNHVMFMQLRTPVRAGDLVPITFITATGGLFKAKVLAKVYNGANETYTSGM